MQRSNSAMNTKRGEPKSSRNMPNKRTLDANNYATGTSDDTVKNKEKDDKGHLHEGKEQFKSMGREVLEKSGEIKNLNRFKGPKNAYTDNNLDDI